MKLNDKRVLPDIMNNIIKNKNITLFSDGTPKRTFCYISDAIIGYLKALCNNKKSKIYNIGASGPQISMRALAKLVLKISKKNISYKKNIIFKKNIEKNYLIDNPDRRCPNMLKSKKELKFKAKVKLEEGLYKLLIYYLNFKK